MKTITCPSCGINVEHKGQLTSGQALSSLGLVALWPGVGIVRWGMKRHKAKHYCECPECGTTWKVD